MSEIFALQSVPQLSAGARVALVAPAGPLRGEGDLSRALDNARAMGWEPVVGAHVMARTGYLAGSDAERLSDFNSALRDPSIDALWCIRGGYGATRILEGIDYPALRDRPRAIMGFSDITALHAAIGVQCNIQGYHGPTARGRLTPFTRNSFERAVVFGEDPCGVAHGARCLVGVGREVRGRLVGGNISLLSSLVGTPYLPDLAGGILVLEDVGEDVYRLDRMLQQLWLSGTLQHIVGIAFGHCTSCDLEPEQGVQDFDDRGNGMVRRTLDLVLTEIAQRLGVPCVAGLPIGHIDEQWTLPLGSIGTLDAEGLTLIVER